MGKVQKAVPVKAGNYIPKAGKKKSYQAPPPVNLEKQRLRTMGEQQFQSDKQLTVPGTKLALDPKTKRIVTKIIDVPVPFLWDESRKRFVYSPPTGKDYRNG